MNSLETLTFRIQDLQKINKDSTALYFVQDMQIDMQAWCQWIQDKLKILSIEPAAEIHEDVRIKLDEIFEQFEQHIETILNKVDKNQFKNQEGEYFYCMLGAFRNVSEALVDYVSSAETINWRQWHEERFA